MEDSIVDKSFVELVTFNERYFNAFGSADMACLDDRVTRAAEFLIDNSKPQPPFNSQELSTMIAQEYIIKPTQASTALTETVAWLKDEANNG